ncbi:MAG: NADH-quinone oxidoreductase subunit NuoF [Phycisphaerae bacterium]
MEKPLTQNIQPNREPLTIKEYEKAGGYQGLRKALKMAPRDIQDQVMKSNLRGRGGAGFLTGNKWKFVPMGQEARHPKFLAINADEMEPGTMKDRLLMEGDPHQLIEGAIVSAYAIEADVIYIFLRMEYKLCAKRLAKAIHEAYDNHCLGENILGSSYSVEMYLHTSAGRYMCGEETGMLNALEGKRATPRNKPPYPAAAGLWGKPTVVNNVETICNVHHIVNRGWEWFKTLSRGDEGGTKIYGASGHVKSPGLWELPMGTPVREILMEHAGGLQDGFTFRGLLPGGASTGFIIDQHLDTPMDFASMDKIGSRLGTGTMIVLDDKTCPVGMLFSLESFFARESCGWCTPCREGLPWVANILNALEEGNGQPGDLEILEEHSRLLAQGNTFCALAPGAMEPLKSALKYFREDFERHITEKRCPWK